MLLPNQEPLGQFLHLILEGDSYMVDEWSSFPRTHQEAEPKVRFFQPPYPPSVPAPFPLKQTPAYNPQRQALPISEQSLGGGNSMGLRASLYTHWSRGTRRKPRSQKSWNWAFSMNLMVHFLTFLFTHWFTLDFQDCLCSCVVCILEGYSRSQK